MLMWTDWNVPPDILFGLILYTRLNLSLVLISDHISPKLEIEVLLLTVPLRLVPDVDTHQDLEGWPAEVNSMEFLLVRLLLISACNI